MKNGTILKQIRKIKVINIQLSLILISLILIIFAIGCMDSKSVLYNVTLSVAASICASAIVSLIDRLHKISFEDEIIEHFNALKIYQENKLSCISYSGFPLSNEDIRRDFLESNRVVLIMNDGKKFLSNNTSMFQERFQEYGKKTILIIADYGCENLMRALNEKNGHPSGYYESKIEEWIRYQIKPAYDNAKKYGHEIVLMLNQHYNTLATLQTEKYSMFSVYRVSSGITDVPHFVFQRGGREYAEVDKDIERLLKSETQIKLVDLEHWEG